MLPPVSHALSAKLAFFSRETPGSVQPLSPAAIIREIYSAEHKADRAREDLLRALSAFEVISPNMFLTERLENGRTVSSFNPSGEAVAQIDALAGRLVQSIKENSNLLYDSKITGLNHETMTEYVYNYLHDFLSGPFSAMLDLDSERPILVLNDLSYTSQQIFRAFSGIYCDATPTLNLSKADFLQFSVYHEIGHKRAAERAVKGCNAHYLPGIDFGINHEALSHTHFLESIADCYAALKHVQNGGTTEFLEQMAAMRALNIFSHSFKPFETPFTLRLGGARRRSEVEHYTAPALDQVVSYVRSLQDLDGLKSMEDSAVMNLAVTFAREHRLSGRDLAELSRFATSLTFNALRRDPSGTIPEHKNSISPAVVVTVLDAVEHRGSFAPRGGDSIEQVFLQSDRHRNTQQISQKLQSIFSRYRQALNYLHQTGVAPFSQEAADLFVTDLLTTLNFSANRTPNITIARALNDAWASEEKCAPHFSMRFDLIGVKQILEECGVNINDFAAQERQYRRAAQRHQGPGELILRLFGASRASTLHPRGSS